MTDSAGKRIVSMWLPRLASDRVLRKRPISGPFGLSIRHANSDRLYCINPEALKLGLAPGMPLSDARAFCPDLLTEPASPEADKAFLLMLRKWATRYCPWVGLEGEDGLVLDITGSAHLHGGEEELVGDMQQRIERAGLCLRIGVADTRGAAWALSRHAPGIAPPGGTRAALQNLPVAALRIERESCIALERVGLREVGELLSRPRAPLARRFGPDVMMRLDQATGRAPEAITPVADPPRFIARLTLPEPIGLADDVMEGTKRLLSQVCLRLGEAQMGARILRLTLRRVDREAQQVTLPLARAMRDPDRILPLFLRGVSEVDAGYGIDQLVLSAIQTAPLQASQISHMGSQNDEKIADLITKLGTRIGLQNLQRFLPSDSHIPERSFTIVPAAHCAPSKAWPKGRERPIKLFAPEPVRASGARLPAKFTWRRMQLSVGRTTGPERITPEWWHNDPEWASGMRDYWKVETRQGRRLWMFYTPQNPGWFVHGEFG